MNAHDYIVNNIDSEEVNLSKYKGKVLLIVNTASKCGFTPQYKELENLYKKIGNENFEILAFPCNQFGHQEPGNNEEVKSFCQLNYGVTFPIFEKIEVNGKNASPLYEYLRNASPGILGNSIKWNFTKFLVDSNGHVVERYAPTTPPEKLEGKILELIHKNLETSKM